MAREKKRNKREDTRADDSAGWRLYLADPASVPLSREDCPCKKQKCERRGSCRECYDFHSAGRRLPYCIRG